MLNHYLIRPTTVDRIRQCWVGEAIERFSNLPRSIAWSEVEKILLAVDRRTAGQTGQTGRYPLHEFRAARQHTIHRIQELLAADLALT